MRLIKLTQGHWAKVSDHWYEPLMLVGPWRWQPSACNPKGYAVRGGGLNRFGEREPLDYMHNIIKPPEPGKTIDHRNLDSLDNQEDNLRQATAAEQCANRSKRVDNTSGATGVVWSDHMQKWRVVVVLKGKRFHIGYFEIFEEAVIARDIAVRLIHGQFARLNRPQGESGDSPTPNEGTQQSETVNRLTSLVRRRIKEKSEAHGLGDLLQE